MKTSCTILIDQSKLCILLGCTVFFLLLASCSKYSDTDQAHDLSKVVIVVKSDNERIRLAAEFLRNEIFNRTGLDLEITADLSKDMEVAILMGLASDYRVHKNLTDLIKPESYAIWSGASDGIPLSINVAGSDERGVLFGAGRLIRELYLSEGFIAAIDMDINEYPSDQVRAQQIITNVQGEDKFMNWDEPEDVQQFVDDMIIFGSNGFEPTQPELVDDYLENLGIDLFIKLKCQDIINLNDADDTQIRNFFSHYKGVDHITSYGGDASGAVEPSLFFPYLDRVIPLILDSQEGSKWWYSNQCLADHAKDYDDYIFNFIQSKEPTYLYGMVYGPWTKRGIREIRADLPGQYVMRHFPDICHPRWAQYPVPQWDRAFAQVWERNKSIYAMPEMMLNIYKATRKNTIGSLPYNHTGAYNDLNKFAWSAVGWNAEIEIDELLTDYAKAFFVHDFDKLPEGMEESRNGTKIEFLEQAKVYVVEGLKLLESNWTGALVNNESTEQALEYWINIADCIGGADKNWRVEMFLYKARIDAQIKRKLDMEKQIEKEVYELIARADVWNREEIINQVKDIFDKIDNEFQPKEAFFVELDELGLIGKFGDIERITSNIYSTLGDKYWILDRLNDAKNVADLKAIMNYENVEADEFYDNLGVAGEQPHLVRPFSWKEDPGFVHSPIEWVDNKVDSDNRHSQHTHALTRYDSPLTMRYDGLDPKAQYQIKVVYNGPFDISIKCTTSDGVLIHDFIGDLDEKVRTFPIPEKATQDGKLELIWIQNSADIMRGVSVSEIWLVKF